MHLRCILYRIYAFLLLVSTQYSHWKVAMLSEKGSDKSDKRWEQVKMFNEKRHDDLLHVVNLCPNWTNNEAISNVLDKGHRLKMN